MVFTNHLQKKFSISGKYIFEYYSNKILFPPFYSGKISLSLKSGYKKINSHGIGTNAIMISIYQNTRICMPHHMIEV